MPRDARAHEPADIDRQTAGSAGALPVFWIDPVGDPRWARLVDGHPGSAVFHTREWLGALRRTYGYEPVAVTTSPPDAPLTSGLVMCRIRSWLTGARYVSLPFSDHAEPLVTTPDELPALLRAARERVRRDGFRYLELRPRSTAFAPGDGFTNSARYCLHVLDLDRPSSVLYANLHKASVQRKLRRAAREGVVIGKGRSGEMLGAFFDLLVMTRRRHGIPPQPFGWFRNLAEAFGERLTIYTASVGGRPIASIMTLEHRDAMVYKYGASDARHHNLGGMASLFWEAIGDARAAGCGEFDLGRADLTNPGLILFKDRLGARQVPLRYWRYEARPAARVLEDAPFRLPERLVAAVPDRMLCLAGRVLYRHMG